VLSPPPWWNPQDRPTSGSQSKPAWVYTESPVPGVFRESRSSANVPGDTVHDLEYKPRKSLSQSRTQRSSAPRFGASGSQHPLVEESVHSTHNTRSRSARHRPVGHQLAGKQWAEPVDDAWRGRIRPQSASRARPKSAQAERRSKAECSEIITEGSGASTGTNPSVEPTMVAKLLEVIEWCE
jgi:hypothetical protein